MADADLGTSARFVARRIVEGFYGEPWSHTTRLGMIDFLAANDMNAFAYAPKDDAKHRAEWREPYSADETARFAELATRGATAGVRFGFAVSPGLDIDYEADTDRQQLLTKMLVLADSGVDWFLLLLDDIPLQPGLGPRHARLTVALVDGLQARIPDVLDGCTDRVRRNAAISVPRRAGRRTTARGRRDVDRADGVLADDHGRRCRRPRPRRGRAGAARVGQLSRERCDDDGVAPSRTVRRPRRRAPRGDEWDPVQPDAAGRGVEGRGRNRGRVPSAIPPRTTETAPGPRPSVRWDATGPGHWERSPTRAPTALPGGPGELELARLVVRLRDEIDGAGWVEAVAAIAVGVACCMPLPDDFAGVDALATEVRPWADGARREAEAGLAALRLVQQIRPVVSVTEGNGHAVAPDADAAMQHAFGLMFTWGVRAERPRRVRSAIRPYTPVVQLAGGLPGLDVALGARGRQCDRRTVPPRARVLCRLDTRRRRPIEAFVDGEPRAVSSTGAFNGSGREIRVHAPRATRRPPVRRCRSAIVGSRDSQAQSGGPVLGLTQRGVRGPEDEAA